MIKRRQIVSSDGKIVVDYADIKNVCMTGSIYALLQYLLLFDDDTVMHRTCYMVGNAVTEEISSRLPAFHFDALADGRNFNPKRWIYKLYLRITKTFRFPFLKSSNIYAIDLGFIVPLIGNLKYSLLADGPLCMTHGAQECSAEFIRRNNRIHTLPGKFERLICGPISMKEMGNNDQCIEFYMTEKNECVSFKDKPVHIKSLKEMWDSAGSEKKEFIKHVFGVDNEDIRILSSRKLMFLTQPIVADRVLDEKEYVDLLKKIFNHYDTEQMLVKLHPRDKFDYKKHFPKLNVYDRPINMQLLVLLGANVERAITISSSAVNAFPVSVEVDWFGADINPKTKDFFGEHAVRPYRKYNQVSL